MGEEAMCVIEKQREGLTFEASTCNYNNFKGLKRKLKKIKVYFLLLHFFHIYIYFEVIYEGVCKSTWKCLG